MSEIPDRIMDEARKRPDLNEKLREAIERVKSMSPEEREAMMETQRKSWVRGMTTPCEHGWLDFEDCPDCRARIRSRTEG